MWSALNRPLRCVGEICESGLDTAATNTMKNEGGGAPHWGGRREGVCGRRQSISTTAGNWRRILASFLASLPCKEIGLSLKRAFGPGPRRPKRRLSATFQCDALEHGRRGLHERDRMKTARRTVGVLHGRHRERRRPFSPARRFTPGSCGASTDRRGRRR